MFIRARILAIGLLLGLLTTAVAGAHPLGNFTINHLAEIDARGSVLHVRYVLDIAEIPTFQIMHDGSDGDWSAAQLDAWAQRETAVVTNGFELQIDGRPVVLRLHDVHARLRPGAGGLPIMYWIANFTAPLRAGTHRFSAIDNVYADRRIGWKDIIVAPQTEPTGQLLVYPTAMIGSPRRVNAVTFTRESDGRAVHIVARTDDEPALAGSTSLARSDALTQMFSSGNRTPLFVLLTMLVAFGLGALHAIEPGHGKALLAFTLVGSRATVKQAVILAASLTFAHTIGVFILGLVLFSATSFVSEAIYPWITLVSGIAVAIIGARNLARYLRARGLHAHAAGHVHAHGFTADHHHGDDDGHGHSHAIPGSGPIDFRGAIVAAMSGGVAPCPAAIVVMLAALRLHQLGYGMVLIVIFSMGLAAVLTGLGIAVVHGSALVTRSRKFDRLVSAGPLISATLISIVGAIMVGQGFASQGVHVSMWIVAGLVAFAIAGYAFTPTHSHLHSAESA